jgi:hypothetical protein
MARIRNYDDRVSFEEAVRRCQQLGEDIQVGHWRGATDLRRMTITDLQRKPGWKVRDPRSNQVFALHDHWFSGPRFLELTA